MDVIMHQQNEAKITSSRSESQFSFWGSRNRAHVALQAASLFFFLFILLSLRMDFYVFSISFFSFNLGRTHMFILCNGIVAILVKGSVLADPHQEGEAEAEAELKNVEVIQKNDEIAAVETEKSVVGFEEEEEQKDQEIVGCVLVAETEQDQQLVEDEIEELSVEELNKKCDEFIRRMRGVISNGNRSM